MKLLVTGSAGFIGSHVVAALRARGDEVVEVDPLGAVPRTFDEVARAGDGSDCEGVVHLGAISSTLERDEKLLHATNVELPQRIWRWCTTRGVPLVYASSAAVYGPAEHGFSEDATCRPLNGYARSKLAFDEWALAQEEAPPSWAGCRYFNVYGPGEGHKGEMASLASKAFDDVRAGRATRLFEWGEQQRDFVWVGDVVSVTLWLLERSVSNVFNVGTGVPTTFEHLVSAVWRHHGEDPRIEWIPIPEEIRDRYQSYTCADIGRLRAAGYDAPFLAPEQAVSRWESAALTDAPS